MDQSHESFNFQKLILQEDEYQFPKTGHINSLFLLLQLIKVVEIFAVSYLLLILLRPLL